MLLGCHGVSFLTMQENSENVGMPCHFSILICSASMGNKSYSNSIMSACLIEYQSFKDLMSYSYSFEIVSA